MDERVKEDKDILQIMDFDTLKNNYTAFEDSLFQNKASDKKVNFQKNIVLAAGWGLIYHLVKLISKNNLSSKERTNSS